MAVISFQPNNSQSRLFIQSKPVVFRWLLALVMSLAFIVADSRYQALDGVRRGFSLFLSPLQSVVDYPARLVTWVDVVFRAKQSLLHENQALQHQQTLLEMRLQKLSVIRHENTQLKALLSAASSDDVRVMAAHILNVETSSSRQLLILNKGTRDGVFVGQPVLDAKGLMGQVIDVGLMTSTVLLISDAKSAVPIRNERTGEQAILVGTNRSHQLLLINLPRTSSMSKGDLLVTSGLGRRYPEGYPVARVDSVKHTTGDEFITVLATPVALLNRNRLALLIWPEKEQDKLTTEITERMHVIEENS